MILAAQQAEIEAMRARLAVLQTGFDATPGGFPALGGTRGPVPGALRPLPPRRDLAEPASKDDGDAARGQSSR